MLRKIAFIILILVVITSPITAQDETDDYPDPTQSDKYDLMEFQTTNFILLYPDGWKDIAKHVARIAENAHAEVTAEVGYAPDVKTHLIIEPYDEIANGSSLSFLNIIKIYLQRPDFISSIDTYLDSWLDLVITHEIVHNVHLGSGNMLTPIPNFLIEGYAVYLESILTSGGRVDSAYGDMVMRTQLLYDDFPTIDEASMRGSFVKSWPLGNISYIIGGYFFKYLYQTYGGDAVRKFNRLNHGDFVLPWIGINARKAFGGKGFAQLWKDFESWAEDEFAPQIEAIKYEETEADYDSYIGFTQTDIATSSGSDKLYFRQYDPHYLPKLISMNHTDGSTDRVKRVFLSDDMGLSNDGSLLAYSLKNPDTYYHHYLSDLYIYDTTTGEDRRITNGRWSSNPDISPDNAMLAYSRSNVGGSAIEISEIDGSNPQVIIDGGIQMTYRHPTFSNDGRYLAFIKADAESRRSIMLYDRESGAIDELVTFDGITLSRPEWSEDDSHLILSTDRSGVFNVYLLNIGTGKLTRVSNLVTGGINPIQKGDRIYFVYYTNNGYELRHISYTEALQMEAESKSWQYYDTIQDEEKTEAPFGSGEIGLRDTEVESGYEDIHPDQISTTDEKGYMPLLHFKNIIPIIYFVPALYITDDGLMFDISTAFYDATLYRQLTVGLNLTIPGEVEYVTAPELLGGYISFYYDYLADIDLDLSTRPIVYSEGDTDYLGRSYHLGLGISLPWRGLGYDSYSIGISTSTTIEHEYNTGGFGGDFRIGIPFRVSLNRFNTIMGFKPVSGFYLSFNPSISIELVEDTKIVYSAWLLNELNLPMLLPDSVTTLRLTIGYADPPRDEPFFSTGGAFKLRSGRDVVVKGNKLVCFSIDSSARLFRLDRGIYPIPIILQGSYITFTFDMAMGFDGDIPLNFFNYIRYGTGIELVVEFALMDSLEFDIITYLYIDPFSFDPTDIESYNIGFIIDIPLLEF